MSATGGLAHEVTCFYKRLASLLSHKWGDEYSIVMVGCSVLCHFPCYTQLFSAFVGPAPQLDIILRLLHQWI